MKPFQVLSQAEDAYKKYVYTFQKFKNPTIRDWVRNRIDRGTLLWRDPNIELSRRFEKGESLESMVDIGLLNSEILSVFRLDPDDPGSDPIVPYKHQSESIKRIMVDDSNTVISTGTGSGKSFCFGIPIVNKCLEMRNDGVEGVKALIVYPMNALANSQYNDFAKRLEGTGLRIALYTGDTKNKREEALKTLEETTGRTEPYDSEVISREEIRDNPPDILMTNYIMLEYILMRFEDQKLFPEKHRGNLKYLVLDEIHTYTGRRGADVAALIRRLKERTNVTGDIKCIGTSATVEAGENENSEELVADFATKLFGEEFKPRNIIGETHIEPEIGKEETIIPEDIKVTDQMLNNFRNDIESTIPIVEALTGKEVSKDEKDKRRIGEILEGQKTIKFLKKNLLENNLSLEELEDKYQEQIRSDFSLSECKKELKGALYAGLVATTIYEGEEIPLITPKLHAFFSQGRTVSSCLTEDGPHLHDKGDNICKVCSEEDKERRTFPLYFCRSCGQEFYGASIDEDQNLVPREINSENEDMEDVYIYPGSFDDEEDLPELFFESKNSLKDRYEDHVPENRLYCPKHNRFETEDTECLYPNEKKLKVSTLKKPFLYCPSCGAHYDKRPKEFNKLFSFGSVGRSTATDIISSNVVSELDPDSQKTIIFSDNRQDTSLQATHINDFQKRLHFRRGLYQGLIKEYEEDPVKLIDLNERIFEVFREKDVVPDYSSESTQFGGDPLEDKYIKYLEYQILQDVRSPTRKNQLNLEDAGLIEYTYRGLEEMSKAEDFWNEAGIPALRDLNPDIRYDYILEFLNIFRRQFAINHEYVTNYRHFKRTVIDDLADPAKFDLGGRAYIKTGYSDEAENIRGSQVMRLTSGRSRLVKWTQKALNVDSDESKDIVENITSILNEQNFLKHEDFEGVIGKLYQLSAQALRVKPVEEEKVKKCPKCGKIHHFKELDVCSGKKCDNLKTHDYNEERNYFRDLYRENFDKAITLEAREHSAQISGDERKEIEENFMKENNSLNTIVATPTMELGIDIGELSTVHMRNVPPNPTNYAQRAGRAGRKGQPSIISTFCGVGKQRGPHDQYFYKRPSKMISGKITQPRFLLNNKSLISSHLNSIIIGTLGSSKAGAGTIKIEEKIKNILNIGDSEKKFPIKTSYEQSIKEKLQQEKLRIKTTFKAAFEEEIKQFPWLDDQFIEKGINNFIRNLDKSFEYWRREYRMLNKELSRLNKKGRNQSLSKSNKKRRGAIESKMYDMREGGIEFHTLSYLRTQGFLPIYGFPGDSVHLVFDDKENELRRDEKIAISEYAPGNTVYFKGKRYTIKHSRPRMEDNEPITRDILVCPNCGNILFGEKAEISSNCPNCGENLEEYPPNSNAMRMTDQYAVSGKKITSDEEERIRRGYKINTGYDIGKSIEEYKVNGKEDKGFKLTYEHNGRILTVNRGLKGGDGSLEGFSFCTECFKWLLSPDGVEKHLSDDNTKSCNRNATEDDIINGVFLYSKGNHDVITLDIPSPDFEEESELLTFYHSIKEAIIQGILVHLNLNEKEIDGIVRPGPERDDERSIVIYETSEGGTGALNSLKEPERLKKVFHTSRKVLHEGEKDACVKACYDCLLSYYNQRYHKYMNRKVALDFLKEYENLSIIGKEQENKFEKLLEKCESSFEEDVLRKIKKTDIQLPDKAQKTIYKDDEPITTPDFFYEPNLAVFVDGSIHKEDHISDMDKDKRRKIKSIGYRVLSIKSPKEIEELENLL